MLFINNSEVLWGYKKIPDVKTSSTSGNNKTNLEIK